jgi:hypothetical protein
MVKEQGGIGKGDQGRGELAMGGTKKRLRHLESEAALEISHEREMGRVQYRDGIMECQGKWSVPGSPPDS